VGSDGTGCARREKPGMKLSARNQIPGVVRTVLTGAVMAEVAIDVDPASITAAITKGSAEGLDLKPGDNVVVIVKATEVIIGKE
jgi:molybdate transport system regulatory protein